MPFFPAFPNGVRTPSTKTTSRRVPGTGVLPKSGGETVVILLASNSLGHTVPSGDRRAYPCSCDGAHVLVRPDAPRFFDRSAVDRQFPATVHQPGRSRIRSGQRNRRLARTVRPGHGDLNIEGFAVEETWPDGSREGAAWSPGRRREWAGPSAWP